MLDAGYDSYEDSRAVVERLYGIAEGAISVSPDDPAWARMRHEAESLFAYDVELVTRDGTLHGPQRLFDDLETQLLHSTLSLDLRDVLGAEDGRVIGVTKFTRKSRENPADHFWNLGGFVFGVRDGRIVFSEGYPNARRACEALGVDPALVP